MYDYRSKFIHGKKEIWPVGYDPDYIDLQNSSKKVDPDLITSIRILSASIQELIIRDYAGIDFSTVHIMNENRLF
jgi:hypothetical protein